MGQLDGKVAIITGGGSGIGKGIAKAFADEGCSVVIAARNGERLNAAAAELSSDGATVIAVPTDVTNEDQVISLFAKTMDQFGRLDVLVSNGLKGRLMTVNFAWPRAATRTLQLGTEE